MDRMLMAQNSGIAIETGESSVSEDFFLLFDETQKCRDNEI